MTGIPANQSAWTVTAQGNPSDVLQLNHEFPVPTKLAESEVLVKVKAAALNPVGYKMMQLTPNILSKRPLVAEHDLAGTIVDANGTHFSNGDEVFGIIPVDLQRQTGMGSLAQYTRLPAENLVIRPPNVSPIEAAGIPLAAETAYQALFEQGKLEPSQVVFINGGSTAVGIFAIQIAKAYECTVIASASAKNEDLVKSLGADKFIDYTKAPLHSYLTENPPSSKYNIFLEAVGLIDPSLYTHCEAYLAPGGVFVTVGPQPHSFGDTLNLLKTVGSVIRPQCLGGIQREWKLVMLTHKKERLEALCKLIVEGKLKPLVDSEFAFQDALKAYEKIMSQRARGKVIVNIEA